MLNEQERLRYLRLKAKKARGSVAPTATLDFTDLPEAGEYAFPPTEVKAFSPGEQTAEALFPRRTKVGMETPEAGFGKKLTASGLDVASLPFRSIATTAGTVAGEIPAAIKQAVTGEAPIDVDYLLKSYQDRLGQTKGNLAETIARDPANVLMGLGKLYQGMKLPAMMAKGAPVMKQVAARTLPALAEGAASGAIHQAENVAADKPISPSEFGTEVGVSALLPAALAALKGTTRGAAGWTMRSQIPAAARRSTGDINEIMDIVTNKKNVIPELDPDAIKTAKGAMSNIQQINQYIDQLGPYEARPGIIVGGGPRGTYFQHSENWPTFDDYLAERVPETFEKKLAPGKLAKMSRYMKTGMEQLWGGLTKGWTKSQTSGNLQKTMDAMELQKKELLDLADDYYKATGQRESMQEVFQNVKNKLDANPKLTPIRTEINNAWDNAYTNFTKEYNMEMLPTDVDKLKRVAGTQGAWQKSVNPRTGELVTILDPEASGRELVYNYIYDEAKNRINNISTGDVGNIIREINENEHKIIPFIKGLDKVMVEQVGPFGIIAPIMAAGAGGVGFSTVGAKGLGAALPALGLGMYGRSQLFPRTMYGIADLIPEMTKATPADVTARQFLRSAINPREEQ